MEISHWSIYKALPAQIFANLMAMKSWRVYKVHLKLFVKPRFYFWELFERNPSRMYRIMAKFHFRGVECASKVDSYWMCYLFVEVTKYL